MNTRSILAIGIILICLFYISGDIFTSISYYEMMQVEDEALTGFGVTPVIFYSFLILLVLKIVLLFKASAVAAYLLPLSESSITNLQMPDVLLVIGIIVCIVDVPNLIMAVLDYNTQVKYIDDPYKAFNEKMDIYESAIRLILTFALMYWRKDLLNMLDTNKDIQS